MKIVQWALRIPSWIVNIIVSFSLSDIYTFHVNVTELLHLLQKNDQKSIFAEIAKFQEVFEETVCGKCGSDNVKFVVRTVDENEYYELRCADCGARLAFGVNKKG